MEIKKIFLSVLFIVFLSGCGHSDAVKKKAESKVQRKAWIIKVKPEKLEEYKRLHANVWPGVLKKLEEVNIRNYSIFYRDGLLFSYLEYTGDDFDADMKKMAADSLTREWWKLTDPCQEPVETAGEGVWWADMEEVFHMD
jgi:L-rhamnose mutarotase